MPSLSILLHAHVTLTRSFTGSYTACHNITQLHVSVTISSPIIQSLHLYNANLSPYLNKHDI